MTKLTPQQIAILGSAESQRDSFVLRPAELKPSAVAKIAAKLIEAGLVRELLTKGDAPAWREDEHGRSYSLKVLKAGRALVAASKDVDVTREDLGRSGRPAGAKIVEPVSSVAAGSSRRPDTKRALVLALLNRDSGASLHDLIVATGWLPHTTRAALTGLRKSGFAIERRRNEGNNSSVYRIKPPAIAAAS